MKEYFILKQRIALTPKELEILRIIGIEVKEKEDFYSKEQQDDLLKNIDFSIRTLNVLKVVCRNLYDTYDLTNIPISDFCSKVSRKDLLKQRNAGLKTVNEIEFKLAQRGFCLKEMKRT